MKKVLPFGLSLLLLACAVQAADEPASADKKNADAAALSGTWSMNVSEEDGQKMAAEDLKKLDIRLTLKDGKYTVQTAGDTTEQGAFTLDTVQKVKTVDIIPADGSMKDKKIQAIYKLEGDTLTVCYDMSGSMRPTSFATKAGTSYFLAVYTRSK
jgi:uncharacterized protein (TIGR03067 family)